MSGAARFTVALAVVLSLVALPGAAPAASVRAAAVYTGPGFDTCSAPSLTSLQAWLGSPYRALGIYIGGANRACPDGNLSAPWAANAVSIGWNLLPLYVGLQAPCVSQPGLALIDPSAAAGQGAAAAADAAARATAFGLRAGSPIYFDMEGYSTKNPACTQAVQSFLTAWTSALHGRGYVAGVYGSAASTIRDLLALADAGSGPDAAWIADWNGNQSVFGDRYVPDAYWPSHQRLHQYTGAHREAYGGVTIDIDSDTVDAPVVGSGSVAPPTAPPTQLPAAGSFTTSDGAASVSWPAAAFSAGATVTATPSTLTAPEDGYGAGGYLLHVTARTSAGVAVARFRLPLTVTFGAPPTGIVPVFSADGATWHALPLEVGGSPPAGATGGYALAPDGSLVVSLLAAGWIGLLHDIAPPTRPATLSGRFVRGRLALTWARATDNSGAVASYEILLDGRPLAAASGATTSASVRSFHPGAASVFRVVAEDAAGNASDASSPVVVRPATKPRLVPRSIPDWAYQLAAWQQGGRRGHRPHAPRVVPRWYWTWRNWRLHPFRIVRGGA